MRAVALCLSVDQTRARPPARAIYISAQSADPAAPQSSTVMEFRARLQAGSRSGLECARPLISYKGGSARRAPRAIFALTVDLKRRGEPAEARAYPARVLYLYSAELGRAVYGAPEGKVLL